MKEKQKPGNLSFIKKITVGIYFTCIFIFGFSKPLKAQKEDEIKESLQEEKINEPKMKMHNAY